jgi:tyrosine-protein phosphatase YwqE
MMAEKVLNLKVDLHTHLLPGVDDGANDIEESLAMLRGMSEVGIQHLYLTPHVRSTYFNNTPASLRPVFDEFRQAATQAAIPVQLDLCAEYYIDATFQEALQANTPLLCFPGNYLLVEISMHQEPLFLFNTLFDIQNKGYRLILAHPERYPYFWNKIDLYRKLKQAGCLLQVNLFSFIGYYGREVKAAAKLLRKHELIDLVATDIHHARQIELLSEKAIRKVLANIEVKNNQFL